MNKEDYFKYYIQGSDHYLIPKDVFNELFNEMENWREEAKELKEKYLNAVVDYETTMFEKEQLNSLVNSCQEEIRRLNKQLKEYKLITIDYQELEQERDKYKEVIDKLNNKINSLKTCEDKPKEDIIYPHWEICNETKQEMLDILKEVEETDTNVGEVE